MERLTVMCVPINLVGHTNATLGIGCALRKRGHRVVFAVDISLKGVFKKQGFEEEVFVEAPEVDENNDNDIPEFNKVALRMSKFMKKSSIEAFNAMVAVYEKTLGQGKYSNSSVDEIIKKWKPDVIIEDRIMPLPALVTAEIPLIKLCSYNPLYVLDNESLPPFFSGLPVNDSSEWQNWQKVKREMLRDIIFRYNEWLGEMDSAIPKLEPDGNYKSTNLNILMYPKSLIEDYLIRCPLSDDFLRVDCVRESISNFEIPHQLKNGKGKLIYFSMGTLGCSIVFLMKRLIAILSKSNHRFIVSKGNSHDQFDLAENMWGGSYLPQLAVLPLVDLIITHGGNNTFCESLYFGKPMIVLPLFADQYDNAQRAVEKNIGLRFNPFTVEEKQLNEAIDKLLGDPKVEMNVKRISGEMRQSNCMEKAVDRIEYVAKHPKFPTITGIVEQKSQ